MTQNIKQLKNFIKNKGYRNYSRLNKQQLINYSNFLKMKVGEIKQVARVGKIKGFSKLTKKNLIQKIFKNNKDLVINPIVVAPVVAPVVEVDNLAELRNNFSSFIENNGNEFNFLEYIEEGITVREIMVIVAEETQYVSDNKYIINLNDVMRMVNAKTMKDINEQLDESVIATSAKTISDAEFIIESVEDITIFHIEKRVAMKFLKNGKEKVKAQGKFFNKYNLTDIDLSKYGIFRKEDKVIYNKNCLIEALIALDCPKKITEDLQSTIINNNFPKSKIHALTEKYNIQIIVKQEDKTVHYGTKGQLYSLALLNNHYFVNETYELTKFALINYYELIKSNTIEEFKTWYRKGKNDKKRTISSYEIVNYMLKTDGYLINIENDVTLQASINYKKVGDSITFLDYDPEFCTKANVFKEKQEITYNMVFADFETHTGGDREHIEDMICYIEEVDGKTYKHSFTGPNCSKYFLDSLHGDSLIVFHNSSYDFTFLIRHFFGDKVIMKGKKLINGCFLYKNKHNKTLKIIIKDSQALIPTRLSEFGAMFNLDIKKEIISHNYYNNLFKTGEAYQPKHSIEQALSYFNEEDQIEFKNNIKEWGLINRYNDKYYSALGYRQKYCFMDCEVLKSGYNSFKKSINEITGLNTDLYLTLASIVDAYFLKEGVYEGVYQLAGTPREFIQKCCVGGRTMSNNNDKQIIINEEIDDFDAVSLYPSAMARLEGYLKGIPIVLKDNQLNYDTIQTFDGYFVEIVINSVGIDRDMPLMSFIGENGIRNWSNDMVGRSMFVDNITLQDLIKFQKIEFSIIRGYYFNDGFNSKIVEIIKSLFKIRAIEKENGNPIQVVYKLMMNSSYGKTILKPIVNDVKIITGKKNMQEYWNYHGVAVETVTKIDNSNKYAIKMIKAVNTHFNNVHCGINVLSMSKRIMNEVICLAEDMEIKVFYQDTDSMHLLKSNIKRLSDKFTEKYNRTLIGKSMGQFHSDFQMTGCKNVVSKAMIVLGKKCYMDRLEGINIKTGKYESDYHLRMKGVTRESIDHTCKINKLSYEQLYTNMHKGIKYDFDLLCGGDVQRFQYNQGRMSYSMARTFTRCLSF